MSDMLLEVEKPALRKGIPNFAPGDAVRVHVKVREGEKERIQVFAGVVIARRGGGVRETFAVRKISSGIGVERIFPLHSPVIDRIEVERKGAVRRAKLYYLQASARARPRASTRSGSTRSGPSTAAAPTRRARRPSSPRSSRSWVVSRSSTVSRAELAAPRLPARRGRGRSRARVPRGPRRRRGGDPAAGLSCSRGSTTRNASTPQSRERLDREVRRHAVAIGVGARRGARRSTSATSFARVCTAMRQAVEALVPQPDALLVDAVTDSGSAPAAAARSCTATRSARRSRPPRSSPRCIATGSSRSSRGGIPAYGFERHKGYGTAEHWEALRRYGPCPEHRLTLRRRGPRNAASEAASAGSASRGRAAPSRRGGPGARGLRPVDRR